MPSRFGGRLLLAGLVAWLGGAAPGGAHPDPSHNVELISQQIAAGDRRPPLFYARGVEYRALDKLAEAEADFRECLRQEPAFLPAKKDLAQVLLDAGKGDEAVAVAREAVALAASKPPAIAASAWSTLARIQLAQKNHPAVLDATREALKLMPRGEVDWYLIREESFRALGRLDAAIADLQAGQASLKSSILRTAWMDALIDAGRGAEALPTIDGQLAESRYKAAWLIRRARVEQQQGRAEAAELDLDAALGEIELHLDPAEPDPTLVVQHGMAWALKGDRAKAGQDLAKARTILPEPDVLAPLERLLGAAPPANVERDRSPQEPR